MALSVAQLETLAGPHTTRAESEVKSNWRNVVEEARELDVIVTNDNRPIAVVVSPDRYAELQRAARSEQGAASEVTAAAPRRDN